MRAGSPTPGSTLDRRAHRDCDHREGRGGVFGGQIFGSGERTGPMGKTGGEESQTRQTQPYLDRR